MRVLRVEYLVPFTIVPHDPSKAELTTRGDLHQKSLKKISPVSMAQKQKTSGSCTKSKSVFVNLAEVLWAQQSTQSSGESSLGHLGPSVYSGGTYQKRQVLQSASVWPAGRSNSQRFIQWVLRAWPPAALLPVQQFLLQEFLKLPRAL